MTIKLLGETVFLFGSQLAQETIGPDCILQTREAHQNLITEPSTSVARI